MGKETEEENGICAAVGVSAKLPVVGRGSWVRAFASCARDWVSRCFRRGCVVVKD